MQTGALLSAIRFTKGIDLRQKSPPQGKRFLSGGLNMRFPAKHRRNC
ncbi:hypothetical protein BN134_1449 [Cronobacter dublinensis 1210]|uniref:Uncharacterized protein n=1 Tax=Cronobacter dublinensis 1210 TaxID=1208656 RepID=A0ABM9Q5M6_9ENTR|nr:hypothetical protein BN134_1449 [Cronobacter dublinensis 1210]